MTNLRDQGVLDSITALKLTNDELPSNSQLRLNVTLDNILATTPSTKATLANDITYLSYTLPNANSVPVMLVTPPIQTPLTLTPTLEPSSVRKMT